MNRTSITFKISVSLACLLVSILLAAQTIGFFPNARKERMQAQLALCETVALQASLAIQNGQDTLMNDTLAAIVNRDPTIAYAHVSRGTEKIAELYSNGDSSLLNESGLTVVTVPIAANNSPWGDVKLGLRPSALRQTSQLSRYLSPFAQFLVFCGCLAIPAFFVYLRRVLEHLDPSDVVPDRVRTTLDTLAEGLVVIDSDQRIVLANNVLASMLDSESNALLGKNISSFPWLFEDEELFDEELPWHTAITQKRIIAGQVLQLTNKAGQKRTLRVNASPIQSGRNECEGALVSFDDVTLLEERNTALTSMLDKLRESRDQIQRQNRELTVLATRDSLTGALNRRCFFEEFDKRWKGGNQETSLLCCIMIDVDHFKSINDTYGHASGDLVLKEVVKTIETSIAPKDILSRYGGEEFCVLVPESPLSAAVELADTIRENISELQIEGIETITASLGVSALIFGAETPNDMLNQADAALYHAKRTGRNRTTNWGDIKDNTDMQNEDDIENRISMETINGLLNALENRDAKTAAHCRRVADLCSATGEAIFNQSETQLLRNAALLHDIGKICVPDSILFKTGPLTDEETQTIRMYSQTGVDIVRATFGCDELADLIMHHHSHKKRVPQPARLLSIADAYDAMVTDQSYRKGLSKEDAAHELAKRAGKQFDPRLVRHFIDFILGRDMNEHSDKPSQAMAAPPIEKQLEKLSAALDSRDAKLVSGTITNVVTAARKLNNPTILELAETLEECTEQDQWLESVRLTVQLMDLCRIASQAQTTPQSTNSDKITFHKSNQRVTARE